MRTIYLDHAATTPVNKEVLRSMQPYFTKAYGNASEPHLLGTQAKMAVETSRAKVAHFLGAKAEEIIFTGSATEAINLAHKGLAEAILLQSPAQKKVHLIVSSIEHKAVMESCRHLEKLRLADITWLPADRYGQVRVEDLASSIRDNTILVSVMYINNEVGTIQPITQIGHLLSEINKQRAVNNQSKVYFHTDATQAIQYLNCQVEQLGVDLLSFSGHKFYAPKGIGALYVRSQTPLIRQTDGGGQEFNRRAGTENVPYTVALAKALELNLKFKTKNLKLLKHLREKLVKGVLQIPGVQLTGHPTERAPHIASFIVDGVEGESLVLLLSHKGVMASTGSACTSQSLQPSHVLYAMGIPAERSHGSLRLSLGTTTTMEEVDYILKILPKIICKLRAMAPNLENFTYE